MRIYKGSLTMLYKATGTLGILGLTSVAFVGVPSLVVAQQGAEKTSASALVGSYIIVAGEKDGKKIPDERIKGSSVRIAENAISTFDKDKKETYAATYRLDTSREPWRLTMTSTIAPVKGEVAEGLIKKDGDTVQFIYAVRGGETPTDFTTEDKQLLFTLKKADAHTARDEDS